MIPDLLNAFGRKSVMALAIAYVSFGLFAYWQADPGSNLKLFLFEFTKTGGTRAQMSAVSGPSIDLSQKATASALPGSIEKACREAVRTTAEQESDFLLNRFRDEHNQEAVVICERYDRELNSSASRLLLARALAAAGRAVESRAIFEDLATKGDSHSNVVLGFVYSDYKERSPIDAITHFVRALAAGEPYGAYGLGRYFELGIHELPDYTQAAAMYGIVSSNLPESRFRLGQLYQYGLGVKEDKKEAMRLLRSAVSSGYDPALSVLRSLDEAH